jgi:aminoglycoside phosphotransferase (APT) family kinase protein
VWVVTDGDHRACLKRLPGDTELAGQRAAAMSCDRLHAAGSPVPRYHFVDVIAGDGFALMDFLPGHPVLLGKLTPAQARHLLELIELQAGAAIVPPDRPDTEASRILELVSEWSRDHPGEAIDVTDRIVAIAGELRDVRLPTSDIVHTDMNPSNFIVDRDGGDRITGIVDWENTTTGDRAADVAVSLFYHWGRPTAEVLLEGLTALTTEESLRLRIVALAAWQTISWRNYPAASWFLDRIPG